MSEMNENIVDVATTDEALAFIVKREDGYHVVDNDVEGDVCPLTKDGKSICLTKNTSNRQWMSVVRLAKWFETTDEPFPLTYKAARKLGDGSARVTMPNAKLISYLSEEDQAEYKAIIDRAIAAREADRKKPMTELEKAQAKIERLKAQIAKLEALENDTPSESEG